MTRRQEQVAQNEDKHRDLNEKIETSYGSHPDSAYMDLLCECGNADCDVFLKVTKAEYEDVRADPRKFIIFGEHFNPDADEIVSEGDRFTLVAKREGEPAEIARQTNPRG